MTDEELNEMAHSAVKEFYDGIRSTVLQTNSAESVFIASMVLISVTLPIILENHSDKSKAKCMFYLENLDKSAVEVIGSNLKERHSEAIKLIDLLMMDVAAHFGKHTETYN